MGTFQDTVAHSSILHTADKPVRALPAHECSKKEDLKFTSHQASRVLKLKPASLIQRYHSLICFLSLVSKIKDSGDVFRHESTSCALRG